MGSRAVAIVCRDADVGARRFKIDDPAGGTLYTRTGRAFFTDPAWQAKVIERTRAAISGGSLGHPRHRLAGARHRAAPVERQG